MAKTKGKPGPKPKHGKRISFNVDLPEQDLDYIRSVSTNTTEWIIQAIKEKREREQK